MSVVVIFGCAVRRGGRPSPMLLARVEAAAAFGRTLDDPLYVPTGAVGRHGPSEASVMARLLADLGVGPARIRLEETATDTLSSVRAVARILRGETGHGETGHGEIGRGEMGPVYVATSGFHQPRCVMLLRLAGLDAHRTPPPPPATQIAKRWYWRLREAAALPYDAALMLVSRG